MEELTFLLIYLDGYILGGFEHFSPSQVNPTASTDFLQPNITGMQELTVDFSQPTSSLGVLEGMIEAPNNIDWVSWYFHENGFIW
jgi:hypothetical protein